MLEYDKQLDTSMSSLYETQETPERTDEKPIRYCTSMSSNSDFSLFAKHHENIVGKHVRSF
jgi:hypothetical protein